MESFLSLLLYYSYRIVFILIISAIMIFILSTFIYGFDTSEKLLREAIFNIRNKIFGLRNQSKNHGGDVIEVANGGRMGKIILSGPLLLEKKPDLEILLNDPNPTMPVRITANNQKEWKSNNDIEMKRYYLISAYLNHPNPEVVIDVLQHHILNSQYTFIELIYLFTHPSMEVRHEAAQVIWKLKDIDNFLTMTLTILSSTGILSSGISWSDALLAVQILQEYCPPKQKKLLEKLAREKGLYTEKLFTEENLDKAQETVEIETSDEPYFHDPEQFNSGHVIFVKEKKELTGLGIIETCQFHRAESAQAAQDFLARNPVNDKCLTIVVETPDGNFGQDIKGIYKEEK